MIVINKIDENTIEVDGIVLVINDYKLTLSQCKLLTSSQIKAVNNILKAMKNNIKIKSTIS